MTRALIHEIVGQVGAGWIDIAGRALLVRQLQFLRDNRVEEVAIEVCIGAEDAARGAWLLGDDPLVARVVIVPTAYPVGSDELARRAGYGANERVLHVPANALVGGTLAFDPESAQRLILPLPIGVHGQPASLEHRAAREVPTTTRTQSAAFSIAIEDLGSALDAACAALEGRTPGVIVHALETAPGIWLARGAHVGRQARIAPPVYVGVDALILDGSRLGPRAVVLDRAVLEQGSSVVDGCVAADTLVGEGTRVRRALATPRTMVNFDDGACISIIDPLTLAGRLPSTTLAARACALVLLLVLGLPWLACAAVWSLRARRAHRVLRARGGVSWRIGSLGLRVLDLVPPLFDVVVGARDLLGVAREDVLALAARCALPAQVPRAGALDLTGRLAARSSPATALAMWRWYARRKTTALDRTLLLGRESRR